MTQISVAASNAKRSNLVPDEGRRAVDVDVTLTIDGAAHKGAVTLVEDHEGRLTSWGSIDHWLSDGLVAVVRGLDAGVRREALSEIETYARDEAADLKAWDYEGYWTAVMGPRSADEVVAEFDLVDSGLDEWVATAEVEAWRAGGEGAMSAEWRGFHSKAVSDLAAAIALRASEAAS